MANCLKELVMVGNIIFIIGGLGLFGYGIYLQPTMDNYLALLGIKNINPSTTIIIVAFLMVILGFFGCCGAWQEDNSCGSCIGVICIIQTVGSLIALLLLLEIVWNLVVYFKQDTFQQHIKETMEDYSKNATENGGITTAWDTVQQSFGCCGVGAPRDWDKTLGKSVPDSCCMEETVECGRDARKIPENNRIYLRGCNEKLSHDGVLLGAVGGVLLIVQLLAIIISCCIARPCCEWDNELANTGD